MDNQLFLGILGFICTLAIGFMIALIVQDVIQIIFLGN